MAYVDRIVNCSIAKMTASSEITFFALNAEFNDCSSLMQTKKAYEEQSNCILVIGNANKVKGDNDFSRKFVYDRVTFSCKAGRERPTQSKGYRQSSTIKKNCPVKIRIALTNNKLIVKESILGHDNHITDRATFDHYPENLRLTDTEAKQAATMISVDGNKKKIKMDLMKGRGGKPMMVKSVHNLQTKMKKALTAGSGNELQKLYDALASIAELRVRFITNDNNEIVGIFVQDQRMARLYEKYPEVMLFDATYKLNKNQMPLFIQCCIDGNGETEIVSLYICRSESREGIEPMLDVFKELNANWRRTKVIIGDKDFADRSVYTDKFPDSILQICLYHVLVTFSREITTMKRDITSAQRTIVLGILMRIAYSRTRESYDLLYAELCALQLQKVLDYYDSCWHSIRDEWTMHGRNQYANYLNFTNNRSERLNRTIKQIGNRYSNILVFFENITTSVSFIASEKDIKAVRAAMRVPRLRFENETLTKYNDFLTPFIFKKIQYEIEASLEVEFSLTTRTMFETTSGHKVSGNSCSCMFVTCMQIPCRHIFALLTIQNEDQFVPSLFAERWTKRYYQQSHPILSAYEALAPHQPISLHKVRAPAEISKYKQVAAITSEINNLASTMSTGQYTHYLDRLKALQQEITNAGNIVPDNSSTTSASVAASPNIVADNSRLVIRSGHNTDSVMHAAGPSSAISNGNTATDRDLLGNVSLPKQIVSIGRPKGSGQTVIGTKRKVPTTINTQATNRKQRKFSDLHANEKALQIIGWLTNLKRFDIERKKKISIDDIIQDANMFNRLRNEHIELPVIKKFVDAKCYKYLCNEVDRLRDTQYWACSHCKKNLTGLQVMCYGCLDWFHASCVGIKSGTQASDIAYFCSSCK